MKPTGPKSSSQGKNYTVAAKGGVKQAHVVLRALENPSYKWRTVDGVAKETGVDTGTVQRVIEKLGAEVVKSSVPSTSGKDLFTTRRRHRSTQSVLSRVGAILRNRAA